MVEWVSMAGTLFRKYNQYLKERFPLEQFLFISLIFGASASLGARAYFSLETAILPGAAISSLAIFLFFLRLRLFDELKDYRHDLRYYPQRPVPRGLISLREVKKSIFFITAAEASIAVCVSPSA